MLNTHTQLGGVQKHMHSPQKDLWWLMWHTEVLTGPEHNASLLHGGKES